MIPLEQMTDKQFERHASGHVKDKGIHQYL
jgi:hypothetical protein